MLILLLTACSLDSLKTDALALTPVPPETPETLASCLASGEELIELGSVRLGTAPLVDLELAPNGVVLALAEDGQLHRVNAAAPETAMASETVGAHGAMLDLAGEQLLVDVGEVWVRSLESAAFTAVEQAGGDSAVSPDGAHVAFSAMVCGFDVGVVDVATGERHELGGESGAHLPLGLEYLDDGRLAARTYTSEGGAALVLFDGLIPEREWRFEGAPDWSAVLETAGGVVLTTTAGDGRQGTLERIDVTRETQSSVPLPFDRVAAVAGGGPLDWVLGEDGTVVASDGASVLAVGTWRDAVDLVADPAGTWIALAGGDGALRVFGCE